MKEEPELTKILSVRSWQRRKRPMPIGDFTLYVFLGAIAVAVILGEIFIR